MKILGGASDVFLPGHHEKVAQHTKFHTVYLGCGICTIAQLVLERMLIATGKTLFSMISRATGAIPNLILDHILIFGYFGAPQLGIAGAALATVIGQFAVTCIALTLNLTKNKEVRLRFTLRPPLYAIKQVLRLGLPTTVLFALNSFMMINYNAVLNQFSSTAVAVFGACCSLPDISEKYFSRQLCTAHNDSPYAALNSVRFSGRLLLSMS